MGQYWHLETLQQDEALAHAVPDLDAALALKGVRVSGEIDGHCTVDLHQWGGKRYYFKHLRSPGSSLRRFMVRSRIRTEWDNLQLFRRLGLATPEPVALGERFKWQMFQEGMLVTAEVPGAIDLAQLAATQGRYLQDRERYAELCCKLAEPLRRLHDIGFAHNDLNWRNVLVTLEPELKVYFFDCPTGRRWSWPFRRFRVAKDLFHLDKMGRRYLSRSQRLRFYLIYAGHSRLDASDKRLLRHILRREVDSKYLPEPSGLTTDQA